MRLGRRGGYAASSRTARARPRTPRSPTSRSRRTAGRSRPARRRAAIASPSTTSSCASRRSWAMPRRYPGRAASLRPPPARSAAVSRAPAAPHQDRLHDRPGDRRLGHDRAARVVGHGRRPPQLLARRPRRRTASLVPAVRRAQELIGRPLAVIGRPAGPEDPHRRGCRAAHVNPGDMLVLRAGRRGAPGELRRDLAGLADAVARTPGQEILDRRRHGAVRVTDGPRRRVSDAGRGGRPGLVGQGREPARASSCRSRR